jgi:hypothetical protein
MEVTFHYGSYFPLWKLLYIMQVTLRYKVLLPAVNILLELLTVSNHFSLFQLNAHDMLNTRT